MDRSQVAAQRLPAGSSSGARSPFFSFHLFVRSDASSFQSLHPAHQGVRGSSRFGAPRHTSSRRWPSRFRIVGTGTPRPFSQPRRRSSPRGQKSPQCPASVPSGSRTDLGGSELLRTTPGASVLTFLGRRAHPNHIRNATASLTPACSGLAALAADARR